MVRPPQGVRAPIFTGGDRLQHGSVLRMRDGEEWRITGATGNGQVVAQEVRGTRRSVKFKRDFAITHVKLGPRQPHTAELLHTLRSRSEIERAGAFAMLQRATAEGDLCAIDKHGQPALGLAAHHGMESLVHTLLELQCEVDQCDFDDQTALHRSSSSGCSACVAALLAAGGVSAYRLPA